MSFDEISVDFHVGTMSPTMINDFPVVRTVLCYCFNSMIYMITLTLLLFYSFLQNATGLGFDFTTTPYYYQGLRFSGRPDDVRCAEALSSNKTLTDETCSDIKICVRETSLALKDDSIFSGLGSVPSKQIVILAAEEEIFGGLVNSTCHLLADYGTALPIERAREAGFTDEYIVGNALVAKQARTLATYDKTPQFNRFIDWIVISLFDAVRIGTTQSTADRFPLTGAFGENQTSALRNALSAAGNMQEIFARAGIVMDSGVPIDNGEVGFLRSHPIGPAKNRGQIIQVEGVLDQIMKRGQLRCAVVANRPGFVSRVDGGDVAGMDVDFCRAVAAAVFSSSNPTQPPVEFAEVAVIEDAENLLFSGEVDIVAGAVWSLVGTSPRPETGLSISVSVPYFYRPTDNDSALPANLCLATYSKDDQVWQSFVHWVVVATFTAERQGITQENAGMMPTVGLFDSKLEGMFQSAIASVGNYDQIYSRHLDVLVPRSGRNMLNTNPQNSLQGPATYIPPIF